MTPRSQENRSIPETCLFCGGLLLPFRGLFRNADPESAILCSCPRCGLYRITGRLVHSLSMDPARRSAAAAFVREAAARGLVPTLHGQHQEAQVIDSPFARALQKCPACRKKPPEQALSGRFVHRGGFDVPCLAGDEWELLESDATPRNTGRSA